jgi:ABC-type dipeptide/oligopeptide/nickel transport system permease subunit
LVTPSAWCRRSTSGTTQYELTIINAAVTVLGLNLLGNALRDVLDPRLE